MEISIDRIRKTINITGEIPAGVILAFFEAEWEKPVYKDVAFPFKKLTNQSYKLVKPWKLLDDTLENIHE